MTQRNKIQAEVEKALQSLDNIQRAKANPFLFTRIRERMNREETAWGKIAGFISRPSFAIATVCFVVLVNAGILFYENRENTVNGSVLQQQALSEISEEYNLAINTTFYDYENP